MTSPAPKTGIKQPEDAGCQNWHDRNDKEHIRACEGRGAHLQQLLPRVGRLKHSSTQKNWNLLFAVR